MPFPTARRSRPQNGLFTTRGALRRLVHVSRADNTAHILAATYWLAYIAGLRLAQFTLRVWRHAWRASTSRFSAESGVIMSAEIWSSRTEFTLAAASVLSLAFWEVQIPNPTTAAFAWLSGLLKGVAICGGALVIAVVISVFSAPDGTRMSRLAVVRLPVVTALEYGVLMTPFVFMHSAAASIWQGQIPTWKIAAPAAVLLFLPVSYWLVWWIRASMLVSTNRFRSSYTSPEFASLTGLFVGCITLVVSVHGIAVVGLAPSGHSPVAGLMSLVLPSTLLVLSALEYWKSA